MVKMGAGICICLQWENVIRGKRLGVGNSKQKMRNILKENGYTL
jgi:hypothetical protein